MAVANGNKLLEQTSYAQAAVEFQKAVKLAGEVNDADRKKTADEAQRYASALAQAKAAGSVEDEIKTLEEALKLKQDAKARDWLREAKDFQNADKAFTAAKYDEALKFCDTRRGTDRFVQLARKAREEQGLWNTVTNALNAGQYDALLRPNPPLPAKPPFENAKSQADEENKVLQDAQKKFSDGNYAFIGTLEGKSYKSKPPYAKIIGERRTEESEMKRRLR